MLEERLTGGCRLDALAMAEQQFRAQSLLEVPDTLAHGGGGNTLAICCARNAALLDDRNEES